MALNIDNWLLADAVRLAEEQHGRFTDDASAIALARASRGDFADRLATRAGALPGATQARDDIRRLRRLATVLAAMLMVAGAVAGWAATQTALAARHVDALLALLALVGVPTVMLLLWLILFLTGGRQGSHGRLPGAVFAAALNWAAPRLMRSQLAPQVLQSCLRLLRTDLGRWWLSSVSHGFWLAYGTAALLAMALHFSLVQYTLTWGTTILDPQTVATMIGTIAWLPSSLNLIPAADPDWIVAAREGAGTAAGRAAWAQFLMAAVALYATLPRLLLVVLCGAMARYQARRLNLDCSLPGFLRLRDALAVTAHSDTDDGPVPSTPPPKRRRRAANAAGPPLLITVEVETDGDTIDLPGIGAQYVGSVNTRAARHQLEAALGAMDRPPPGLVALCSLLRTPDAGTTAVLARMADLADAPLLLVLEDREHLVQRGADTAPREADWQRLAATIGADTVVLDRHHPDTTAVAFIRQWLGYEGGPQ